MKKVLGIVLAVACLLSLSVPAFAASVRMATEELIPEPAPEHENLARQFYIQGVTPIATACPDCGDEYTFVSSTSFTSWTNDGNEWRVCPTRPEYNDRKQERIVTTTSRCRSCGYGAVDSVNETRWYCTNRKYAHPNG